MDQILPLLAFVKQQPQKKEKLCSQSFEFGSLKGTASHEWQWLGDTVNDPNVHMPLWTKSSGGHDKPAALFQFTLDGFPSVI